MVCSLILLSWFDQQNLREQKGDSKRDAWSLLSP
jgi:hypothetical protein